MWIKAKDGAKSQMAVKEVKQTASTKQNFTQRLIRSLCKSYLWKKTCCACEEPPPPPPPPPLPQKCEKDPSDPRFISGHSIDSPRKSAQYSTGIGKSSDESMFRSVTPVSFGDHPSDSNSAATVISVNDVSHKRPQATRQLSSPRLIDARATASASALHTSHSQVHHQKQSSNSSSTGHAFAEPNVPYSRHSRRFYENPGFQTEAHNATASASASSLVIGPNSNTTVTATASASVTGMGASRVYEPAVWDLSAPRSSRPDGATNGFASTKPSGDPRGEVRGDVRGDPRGEPLTVRPLSMMEAGAVLSIASQLSSDLYTDDEPGMRDALNYSTDNLRESCDPINRPNPALGHYRDSLVSQDNSSVDAPPDLLPSPTIRSRLRLLLNKAGGPPESEASSDADIYGSVAGSEMMIEDADGMSSIKQQVAGLETMYKDILRVLGVDNKLVPTTSQLKAIELVKSQGVVQNQTQNHMPVRRRLRHFGQRSNQEIKTINKRVEKLESHVVTLAQCVSEISTDLHQIRLQNSVRGSARGSSTRTGQASDTVTADGGSSDSPTLPSNTIRNIKLCMSDPKRLTKLKWFFGMEPPFMREFLESLGYEKYVKRFENEHIGLMEMGFMTEDRLRTLGVPLGPRLRILEEIQNIFRGSLAPIHTPSTSGCLV